MCVTHLKDSVTPSVIVALFQRTVQFSLRLVGNHICTSRYLK